VGADGKVIMLKNVREIDCEDVDWSFLPQDRVNL
jgi:hypothetical protein